MRSDLRPPTRLDVPGVLRGALATAQRDRVVLAGIAGLFLFVPQLVTLLYVGELPVGPGWGATPEVTRAYADAVAAWFAQNGALLCGVAMTTQVAPIAIVLLYVDARRPDVAGALLAVPAVFFPTLLAGLIVNPIAFTLLTLPPLILLGVYLQGRLLLALPVLLGVRPVSVVGAIRTSWAGTRGHGLGMAGLACIAVLAGPVLSAPLRLLGASFGGAPLANPAVAVALDAATALIWSVGIVYGLLIQVEAYRRLSSGM